MKQVDLSKQNTLETNNRILILMLLLTFLTHLLIISQTITYTGEQGHILLHEADVPK